LAVGSGGDKHSIWKTVKPVEHTVIAAVEKLFHFTTEGSQVFGGAEDEAVGRQQIVRFGMLCAAKFCREAVCSVESLRHFQRAFVGRLRHLARSAGARVPDYE